jgi:clan AA aspartic protease
MGEVSAEITLKNGADLILAGKGHISEQNIRSVTVTAVVDTGATTLVISENLRKKLGLATVGIRPVTLAGGSKASCDVTEPVQICWKNRTSSVRAWVMPDEDEVLLGVIPLEEMDLIVDPGNRSLVGAHGEEMMGRIK